MLRNVNRLKTLVNDEGQMTNDSHSQLALIVPTYLAMEQKTGITKN
ncbi:hypothetical protein LC605_07815 [Nostoc sp. CHAB 5836]|nr:hypothetical protein [Nostoc sp. CHAB 5836]MCC5614984.1 hypothetical protein [Nostoc sp. CHAB 5836]